MMYNLAFEETSHVGKQNGKEAISQWFPLEGDMNRQDIKNAMSSLTMNFVFKISVLFYLHSFQDPTSCLVHNSLVLNIGIIKKKGQLYCILHKDHHNVRK